MGKMYLLTNVTELDRVTPKVALPEQNFSYDDLLKNEYTPYVAPVLSGTMVLVPVDGNPELESIYTSRINAITELDNQLIVETRNTVYFFDIL